MEQAKNFEQASRLKLRIETSCGMLSVEDLWDLPLTSTAGKANLDDIARDLHFKVKDSEQISFVNKPAKRDDNADVMFEIVKHIISVRLAENEARAKAQANAQKKQQLMALIVSKENEALGARSVDELKKMLEEIDG